MLILKKGSRYLGNTVTTTVDEVEKLYKMGAICILDGKWLSESRKEDEDSKGHMDIAMSAGLQIMN